MNLLQSQWTTAFPLRWAEGEVKVVSDNIGPAVYHNVSN